jgi:hypothetical protein
MVTLRDKETGRVLGTITEEQLQFLTEELEEESDEDADYYLDRATLEYFAESGIDPGLLDLLTQALGDRDDMEIEWVRG